MEITRIELQDWLYHRHLIIDLSPMTLICGPNAIGKTSIADAIKFALDGQPVRITKAGQRNLLIRRGARSGNVKLTFGQGESEVTFSRNVCDGKLKQPAPLNPPEDAVPEAVPYLLEPRRFATASADDRRTLLLKVMRAPTGLDEIRAELEARGHVRAVVLPKHAASISDWQQYAERQASEHRGTWKQITGETYGSIKADNWTLDIKSPDPEAIPGLERDAQGLREQTGQLRTRLGEAQARQKSAEWRARRIALLRAKIAGKAKAGESAVSLQNDRAKALAALTSAEAVLLDLRARYQPATPLVCTECGTLHKLEKGTLVALPPVTKGQPVGQSDLLNAEAAVSKAQSNIAMTEQLIQSRTQALQEIAQAETVIAEIEAEPLGEVADTEALYAAILKKENKDLPAILDKLANARATERDAENARQAIEKARQAHQAVKEWVALSELLKPSGLPAEWLAKALGPLNAHLAELATKARWPQITLLEDADEGIAIMRGEEPYVLASESDKWRADALLALALAEESKLGFVCLDRFDVLGVPLRKPALGFLHGLLRAKRLDTVMLLGTLTAPPVAPPDVKVHWLGDVVPAEQVAA